jgi:hypothetical protein
VRVTENPDQGPLLRNAPPCVHPFRNKVCAALRQFCFAQFAVNGDEVVREGWATADEYRWICGSCFQDHREQFLWTVLSRATDARELR